MSNDQPNQAQAKPPVVFISYAHEGDMGLRVKALAEFLLANGIQAITDHPYENRHPEQGWRAWMQHNVEDADFVLVVCTPRYKALFEKRELPPQDEGGYGVTWESAIITDDLYQSKLTNTRFFPILPDGGTPSDIPVVLRDFYNGHRFPSGYDRILKLIKEEVRIPKPQQGFNAYLTGELRGFSDSRLTPREKAGVIGRDDLTGQVVDFLKGADSGLAVSGYVSGCGGIGKTEVCKAALKNWLQTDASARAFWIQVPDNSEPLQLIQLLGRAVDIADEQLAQITGLDQLANHLPPALYYLDNLESLADRPEGLALLRQFSKLPQIRVLASSRVSLDSIWSNSIEVEPLLLEDAISLFLQTWNGKAKPNPEDVADFVQNELGCHPLSIVLIARLGKGRSYAKVTELWQQKGTVQAQQKDSQHRHDSLEKALAITVDQLKNTPAALHLWQFIVLNNDGVEEAVLDSWDEVVETLLSQDGLDKQALENMFGEEPEDARRVLIEHHLIQQQENGYYSMLPPLARYALEPAQRTESADAGFLWPIAKQLAYITFLKVSERAREIESTPELVDIKHRSAAQIPALLKLLKIDSPSSDSSDISVLSQINYQLGNVFQFGSLDAQKLLQQFIQVLPKGKSLANALQSLGDLESRLGQVDVARGYYDEAIEYYKAERDQLGLANALQSLGDLESRLGQVDVARGYYEEAIEYYKAERDQLGLANALKSLGDLESRLGQVDVARGYYDEAIEYYKAERDQLGLANALKSLGDLESRLGQVDVARGYYEEAIEYYKAERAKLGLANALQSLGDLESRLGQVDVARGYYEEAIEYYKAERAKLGLANALKSLGDLESRLGQVDVARGYYEEAIEYYKAERAKLGLANALQSLGDLESRLGQVDVARGYYDEAIEYYKAERDQLGLANALQSLGDLESRLGQVDVARGYCEEAIEYYKAERAKLGLAKALKSLGDLESRLGQVDVARGYYEEAIEYYKAERSKLGLANALQSLGDLESRLGQVDVARGYYDEAIEYYKAERDQLGLANALQSLGDLESRLGQVDVARGYCEEAIEYYKAERAKLGLAKALKSLGDLESRLGQVDVARGYYEEAIEYYKAERSKLGLANALQSLGDLESRLGQVDVARGHYESAMELFKAERSKLGLADVLKSLGDLESRLGQVDVARGYCEEAIEYYKAERSKLGLANVNLLLGILNRSESEWDSARKNFVQAFELFSAERAPMGLAYTCAELIRCEKHGGVAAEAIGPLVIQALTSAEASGVPSVGQYVAAAIVEFFDGDVEKAQAFLHELSSASEGE